MGYHGPEEREADEVEGDIHGQTSRGSLSPFLAIIGGLVILVVEACSDSERQAPLLRGERVFLEIASGNEQQGETGQELAEPIAIRVHAQAGEVITGTTVSFEVTVGGGRLSAASAVGFLRDSWSGRVEDPL